MSEAAESPSPAKPGAAVRRARFPRAKPNLLEAGRRIGPPTTPAVSPKPAAAAAAVEAEIKPPPPVRRITRFTPVLGTRNATPEAKPRAEAPVQRPTEPVAASPEPVPAPALVQPLPAEEKLSPTVSLEPEPAAVAPAPVATESSADAVIPPSPDTASPSATSVPAPSEPATLMPAPSSSGVTPTTPPSATKTDAAVSAQSPTSSPVKQRKRKLSSRGGESTETIAGRRTKYKKGAEPPEKGKMTMFDLIHWNPPKNPMTYEEDEDDIAMPLSGVAAGDSTNEERLAEERVDDPGEDKGGGGEDDDDDEECMPMPQVKIGPDGSIVLDEKSLVIETTKSKKDPGSSTIVYERSSHTTYASYRKKKPTRYWSERETTRFYVALSTVGTDFSMMLNLFPKRTRHELKTKFKKEDRVNKFLVDKAINDHQQYDLAIFQDNDELNLDEEEAEAEEMRRAKAESKARGRQRKSKPPTESKKPSKSKRRVRLQEESDESESELDESKLSDCTAADDKEEAEKQPVEETTSENNDEHDDGTERASDDDDDENATCEAAAAVECAAPPPKPTRSGRQPRKKSVFTISIDAPRRRGPRRATPASLESLTPTRTRGEEGEEPGGDADDTPQLVFFAENPTANGSQKVHMLLVSPPPQAGAPRTAVEGVVPFAAAPPPSTPTRVTVPAEPTSPPTPDHSYSLASLSPCPVEPADGSPSSSLRPKRSTDDDAAAPSDLCRT